MRLRLKVILRIRLRLRLRLKLRLRLRQVGRASCRDLDVPAWFDSRVRRRTARGLIERPLALPAAHAAAIEADAPRFPPFLDLSWPRVPVTGKLRTLRKFRTKQTTHARLQSCVRKRTSA